MSALKYWRAGAILAAFVLAYFSMAHSFAMAATRNPWFATTVAPWVAAPKARLANVLLQSAEPVKSMGEVEALSRSALRRQPLIPMAVRNLALVTLHRNDKTRAEKLIDLSASMSRRDVATQMWLIERAVAQDDIGKALRHYDTALSTDQDSSGALFPVLLGSLSFPEVRQHLAELIKQKPTWLPGFFDYAQGQKTNLEFLSAATLQSKVPLSSLMDENRQRATIFALLAKGEFAAGAKFYLATQGADPAILTQTGFSDKTIDGRMAPLKWGIVDEADYGMSNQSGNWTAYASPAAKGMVAEKIVYLRPGSYYLSASAGAPLPSGQSGEALYWTVRCAVDDSGPDIARLDLIGPAKAMQTSFITGANCPVIRVRLLIAGVKKGEEDMQVPVVAPIVKPVK